MDLDTVDLVARRLMEMSAPKDSRYEWERHPYNKYQIHSLINKKNHKFQQQVVTVQIQCN